VAGRSRTCAPRVSSGRSTGLSYGHEYERGWSRTSDLLFVRQALIPAELLAPNPGQGIEPRPPGSEPGVLPVRPSRSDLRADTPAPGRPPATQVVHHSVHLHLGDPRSGATLPRMSRPAGAERCFPSHSPYSSTLDRASSAGDARLRGGALEPGTCSMARKGIGKPRINMSVSFSAHSSARDLSPSGGASMRSRSSSS
jgi:hypothetical protein